MKRHWEGVEAINDIGNYIISSNKTEDLLRDQAICSAVRSMLDDVETPDLNHRDFSLDFIIIARDSDKYGNQTCEVKLTDYKPYGCEYTYGDITYKVGEGMTAKKLQEPPIIYVDKTGTYGIGDSAVLPALTK